MRAIFVLVAFGLTACNSDEIENVEAHAENQSRRLENRMAELEAMAENETAEMAAPLENEAEALLNQLNGSVADANAPETAGNKQ